MFLEYLQRIFNSYIKTQPNLYSHKLCAHFGKIRFILSRAVASISLFELVQLFRPTHIVCDVK